MPRERPRTIRERLERLERGQRQLRAQLRSHLGRRTDGIEVVGFVPEGGWLDEDDLEVEDGALEPICHKRGKGDTL